MAEEAQQTTPPVVQQSNLATMPTPQQRAVAPWVPLEWTPERVALVKKQIAPPGCSDGELQYFLEWSKQTGLNPFIKQCYLIERWDAVSNAKKFDPMVAEAGFAARADALPDFRGMTSGVVYAGDEFMIDEVTQQITHRWSVEARTVKGNKIVGAWAHARRDGRVIEITFVTFDSRAQRKKDGSLTRFWATDGAGQIRKCARADQYRRAYPNIFAGWYEPAEFTDEVEVNAAPTAAAAAPGDAQAKSAALKQRLGVKPVTIDAAPKVQTPAATPAKGAKAPAAAAPATSAAPPIDFVRFGPTKGTAIADASTIELEEALAVAHKQLANATGKEAWINSVREGVDAIDAEIARRESSDTQPTDAAPPEPGSEG